MIWEWIIFILFVIIILVLSIVGYRIKKGKSERLNSGDVWLDDDMGAPAPPID